MLFILPKLNNPAPYRILYALVARSSLLIACVVRRIISL